MIEGVSAYIKNIVGLMVMTAFGEMIIPKGSYRPFVKLVMGFIIITALIEPGITLIYGEGFYRGVYDNSRGFKDYDKKAQQTLVREAYEEALKNRIISISSALGVDTYSMELLVDEKTGNVLEVNISIDDAYAYKEEYINELKRELKCEKVFLLKKR